MNIKNKIYSGIFALLAVFALSGNGFATTFNIGLINSPDSIGVGNSVTFGGSLPSGAGLISDNYLFSVDTLSSFGSSFTSVVVRANAGFTSFNTALYVDQGGWNLLASSPGVFSPGGGSNGEWSSSLFYSPLDPAPASYMLAVSGTKLAGSASYGGSIAVAPIPEPEVYAMMVMGFSLMGFAARRRKAAASSNA